MMINSVKVKKMLSKGCITYLTHVMNISDETVLGVKDILVV